ncbi:hypothetical protein DXG01_002106 [Tephrocybe rancida]|nr:hypothetical protein DXG01_002106 [Tephrocybe rancida]
MRCSVSFLLSTISVVSAAAVKRGSPVHLAVSPKCGTLDGPVADVNAGLAPLNTFKTIVTFGDGYSDNGVRDGSVAKAPVLTPPNPKAGGRPSNGLVWVEHLAQAAGATLKGYAADGAVVDAGQYPGSKNLAPSPNTDLIGQVNFFTSQGATYNRDTTLYTIFFGINDYVDGGNLDLAAQNIAYEILVLTSSPTFARNILIVDDYGRGTTSPAGEAYKQAVFSMLPTLKNKFGINVAFVDLSTIWKGVLGSSPGYQAFGYTNPGACTVNNSTTVGACSSPDTSFYWLPGTPSAATHGIVADYVSEVLTQCKI